MGHAYDPHDGAQGAVLAQVVDQEEVLVVDRVAEVPEVVQVGVQVEAQVVAHVADLVEVRDVEGMLYSSILPDELFLALSARVLYLLVSLFLFFWSFVHLIFVSDGRFDLNNSKICCVVTRTSFLYRGDVRSCINLTTQVGKSTQIGNNKFWLTTQLIVFEQFVKNTLYSK